MCIATYAYVHAVYKFKGVGCELNTHMDTHYMTVVRQLAISYLAICT